MNRSPLAGFLTLVFAIPGIAADPLDRPLPENARRLEALIGEALDRLPEEAHHERTDRARTLAMDLADLRRHARQLRYLVQSGPVGGMPGTFMPSGRGTAPLFTGPNGTAIRSYHPGEAVDPTRRSRRGFTGGDQPFDETARREFRELVERGRRIDRSLEEMETPGLSSLWDDEITPLMRAINDQLVGF